MDNYYYVKFNNKDFKENPRLLIELLQLERKFREVIKDYDETRLKEFMKNEKIDLNIDLKMGSKKFIAYTMDLTKKYIEINSDYRS